MVPGAQAPSSTQIDWLSPDVYVPDAQASHTRSLVAVPAVDTKVPATQVV